MVEGAGVIIVVTLCVIGVLIAACWLIDKRARKGIEDFAEAYPLGDATDTPNVIHMTRRANHRRGL